MKSLPILKESGIYTFKNKLNGKSYVGQSKDVRTRKKQHERGDTNNSRRFHNAMVKHGPDAFEFTVLEYCEIKKLDERESYWINKIDCLYPKGYNLTSGGGAFQKHNFETKKIFSKNQKEKIKLGIHLFNDPKFQEDQRVKQIELARQGLHPTQSKEFKDKRNTTVQKKINQQGKFFSHSADEKERKSKEQKLLYAKGLGKFQQTEFIEKNRITVQKKLAEGQHHTQRDGWLEKSIEAHKKEMKPIVLCIRTFDGKSKTEKFESINDAVRKLEARKKSISEICNQSDSIKKCVCNQGMIIKGNFGNQPNWTQKEVDSISNESLSRKIQVQVTVQKNDGKFLIKKFDSQREACRELDAEHRALRYMLKGEKYKSTKCNLGRIVLVEEV